MPTEAEIRGIIAKIEKQCRDLNEIVIALREIGDLSPQGVHDRSLNDHEKRLLSEALRRISEAARILQVSRDKLRYKMAEHGLRHK
jgi:DNA-binding NtrC family response regulator